MEVRLRNNFGALDEQRAIGSELLFDDCSSISLYMQISSVLFIGA